MDFEYETQSLPVSYDTTCWNTSYRAVSGNIVSTSPNNSQERSLFSVATNQSTLTKSFQHPIPARVVRDSKTYDHVSRILDVNSDEVLDLPDSTELYTLHRSRLQRPEVSTSIQHGVMSSEEIMPDRLLLSPSEAKPLNQARPSSRKTLTRALELAREAVRLDSTNDDPYGAIVAYGKSVTLLHEVMERVLRGEDGSDNSHRRHSGRRRSIVAQEEEVRRLKSIVSR